MKTIATFSGMLFLICSACFGQVEIYSYSSGVEGSTDISGTTVMVDVTADGALSRSFRVKNVSGTTMDFTVERYRVSSVPNWTDGLCWGSTAVGNYQGGCYGPQQMTTNPWSSPVVSLYPDTVRGTLLIDLTTQGGGCAHYRYYVVSGTTRVDSIDLQVCSIAGLEEEPTNNAFQLYPNPASTEFSWTGTAIPATAELRILDVSGKIVYVGPAAPVTDVRLLKEGLYWVSVTDKGQTIHTERLIIRH